MREKSVQDYLIEQAKSAYGGKAIKQSSQGSAGEGDVLVGLPGGRVGVCEVKRPGGDPPTPLQAHRLSEWREVGVFASWAATHGQADRFLRLLASRSGMFDTNEQALEWAQWASREMERARG